jgi:hypothetical protein
MQKKRKKTETQQNTYEGITVDISDISDKLTDRARRFVFWYCFPATDTFQNKKRAAIAAGYVARSAAISGYKLCKNQLVMDEIERVTKSYNAETIDTLYQKYINSLELKAFFDPADFITGDKFKAIENIAPEKRICLEQAIIDMKGGNIVGYSFGSRRAAVAEIKELHAKQHQEKQGFEEEETREMIMERVTVREARRKAHREAYPDYEKDIVTAPLQVENEDEE